MPTVYKETTAAGKVRWKLAYRDRNGVRRFMRVARLNKKDAESFAWRVEQLASAAASNSRPAADLIRWADGLPQHLRKKLIDARLVKLEADQPVGNWLSVDFRERMIEAGVIRPGEPVDDSWLAPEFRKRLADAGLVEPITGQTLGEWLDRFITGHRNVKPQTLVVMEKARRNLLEHFGADRPLASITAHDAKEWRAWLATEGNRRDTGSKQNKTTPRKSLADNTVRRRTGIARQFFAAAVDAGLLDRNPFEKLAATTHGNDKRQFFVPAAWIDRCIEHAPCGDWRTILALSRYGGLRCPSEILRLRWEDVDLPAGRMTLHAPKTEHHSAGGVRQCPIFPELRPHLEAAWDALPEEGPEFVINRYRSGEQNLRSMFEKIIKRAGLQPWPKLFQNLRASRETELLGVFPAKDVAAWLGNSVPVAMKHYAMPREETFTRATREGIAVQELPAKTAGKGPETAAEGVEQTGGTNNGTTSGRQPYSALVRE